MLAIQLDQSIEVRLDQLAQKTRRMRTFCARKAILEHLQDMENYYWAVDVLVLEAGHRKGIY